MAVNKKLILGIFIPLIICILGLVSYGLITLIGVKSKPAGVSGEVITLNELLTYLGTAKVFEEEHEYYVLATSSFKAGDAYDVVDVLCLEEEIIVLGKYADKYRVYTKSGKLGWISIKLISVNEPDGVPYINPY